MLMGTAETPAAGDDVLDVMTADEVAKWLRVSVHTVRRAAAAGRLPGQRVGKGWRFSRAGLLVWMSEASENARSARRSSST